MSLLIDKCFPDDELSNVSLHSRIFVPWLLRTYRNFQLWIPDLSTRLITTHRPIFQESRWLWEWGRIINRFSRYSVWDKWRCRYWSEIKQRSNEDDASDARFRLPETTGAAASLCTSNACICAAVSRMSLRNCDADTRARCTRRRRLSTPVSTGVQQDAYKYTGYLLPAYPIRGRRPISRGRRSGYRLVVNGANQLVDTNFTITNRMNIDRKLERASTRGVSFTSGFFNNSRIIHGSFAANVYQVSDNRGLPSFANPSRRDFL